MCIPNIVLRCFVLLLIISFSESQENFTNGVEQSDNSTVHNNSIVSPMKYQNDEMESTRCNLQENSIKNNETQYEFCTNSTKNDCKNNDSVQYESHGHIIKNQEENNQMSTEFCANSTEINDSTLQEINENLTKIEGENNSTLYKKLYRNSNTDYNNSYITTIIPYEECNNVICIQLCCSPDNHLTPKGECVYSNYSIPKVKKYINNSKDKKFELSFTVYDPCLTQEVGRRLLPAYEYLLLANGSLYHNDSSKLILPSSYCIAKLVLNIYDVIICTKRTSIPVYIPACYFVSLPFLLLTFIVYSVLPELQNMHGYTLRGHVASLFITYTIMFCDQLIPRLATTAVEACISLAYIFNFFFLSSFFWLNVTCFDIWWTFRSIRSRQTNIQQEKKRFIMYSIYAWGIPFVLTVIDAIVDIIGNDFPNIIRPEMCEKKFWYGEDLAKTIYFYLPMGVTIISNICFFIVTTRTIRRQNVQTAHQLRGSESQRHNENKQRFIMYMKLFIVMGITWVLEIISWSISLELVPQFVWYPTMVINALQGLIIFIIFVCTKKIKRLLLKRFGEQNCGPFCKIPINNDSTVSTSNSTSISTLESGTISMREMHSN